MLELLQIAIGLLSGYIIVWLVLIVFKPLGQLAASVKEGLLGPLNSQVQLAQDESRLNKLQAEIEQQLQPDHGWGSAARREMVQAAHAAQRLTVLNQKFRETIHACNRTHWAVANGLRATHMSEAARHPLCGQLRQRVIDLSELLSAQLEQYPLLVETPELIRLQLGVSWIGPTCATCPYFATSVIDAPRICPAAQAIGPNSNNACPPNPPAKI